MLGSKNAPRRMRRPPADPGTPRAWIYRSRKASLAKLSRDWYARASPIEKRAPCREMDTKNRHPPLGTSGARLVVPPPLRRRSSSPTLSRRALGAIRRPCIGGQLAWARHRRRLLDVPGSGRLLERCSGVFFLSVTDTASQLPRLSKSCPLSTRPHRRYTQPQLIKVP